MRDRVVSGGKDALAYGQGMRVAVSGTHGSGKSTLISAFLDVCPEYIDEPEPFEFLDEAPEEPGAESFFTQLQISMSRQRSFPFGMDVVAERCPLDFLAYLYALDDLGRPNASPELSEQAAGFFPTAMDHLDLLVVLSLDLARPISVPEWEDLELRDRMNTILLELSDDLGVVGSDLTVAEINGTPPQRLVALIDLASR